MPITRRELLWRIAAGLAASQLTACPFAGGGASVAPARAGKFRGMRVDPGRLYDLPGYDAATIAAEVVRDARLAAVDMLVVYAHNPVFGAFYPTNYPATEVEGGLGAADFLGQVLHLTAPHGIRVVAAVPVNSFRRAWLDNPAWRVRTRGGADYDPDAPDARLTFPLSGWHDGFRDWYAGLLRDLLTRHPTLAGVEAWEGELDRRWTNEVDHNAEAVRKFRERYPHGSFDGPEWRSFRAEALTRLYATLAAEAHAAGRMALVVQTWAARPDGTLMTPVEIRDGSGFDFNGIMDLPPPGRPDVVTAELIWQQWRAEHGTAVFTPDWTRAASREFVHFAAGRVRPLAHVELTAFPEEHPVVTPTVNEFRTALGHAFGEAEGATFYDYTLMRQRGASDAVRAVYET